MNKRLWIIPIALILLTAVFVGYLGSRDVTPDSMVCKTNPDDCVTVTESDALYLLEHQRALFDRCFDAFSAGESYTLPDGVLYAVEAPDALSLVVESAPGLTVAIGRGAQLPPAEETRGGEGYNLARVCRALIGDWFYCVDYTCGLTFTDVYAKRLRSGLTKEELASLAPDAIANAVYVLIDADKAPETSARSTSRYAVCALLLRSDGTQMRAMLDPKRKAFLGIAAD